jgi:membrane protein DedA with SNARE-associated domain/rhodanese-related sulfurtransferase
MDPVALLVQWGIPLVFAVVLIDQGGLPIPSEPLLIAAGALAQTGAMRPELLLLAATLACLISDSAWFFIGRKYGRRLLAGLCRVSLEPDTCVRNADDLIERHGPRLLLIQKFIPGVSAVAVPTAGASAMSFRRFISYDVFGCTIWCGAWLGGGLIFSREVNKLLARLSDFGPKAVAIVLGIFATYIAWKVFRRWQLRRLHELVRISPEEVAALIDAEHDLVILDARSSLARADDPRVFPHSIVLADRMATDVLTDAHRGHTIVTFCTCPNEASAALAAEQLIKAGYRNVRVLTGGEHAVTVLGLKG